MTDDEEAMKAAAVAAAKIRPVLPSRASQGLGLERLFAPDEKPSMPPEPMFNEPLPQAPETIREIINRAAHETGKKRKAAVPKKRKTFAALQGAPKRARKKTKPDLPSRRAPHGIGPRRSDASLASLSGKAPRKNPNRPKELKQQLDVVINAMATLSNPERTAFAGMIGMLDGLSRPGRKEVLAALARVYA